MQVNASTATRCIARNKRGEPCAAYARPGRDYCWAHDPELVEERQAARSKGGKARHGRTLKEARTFSDDRPPTQIRSVDDVLTLLETAIHDLLKLENSISRGRALGTLAMAALKALEVGDLENRIAILEQAVDRNAAN